MDATTRTVEGGGMSELVNTIHIDIPDKTEFGRECCICGEVFNLMEINDPTTICPECIRRLMKLLYGEIKNDD